MLVFSHDDGLGHETPPGHPECADRLRAVERGLAGLALTRRESPLADEAELRRCHPAAYVARVKAAVPEDGWSQLDGDTFLSPGSWTAALRAVGGVCAAVDAVLAGEAPTVFVAARPPGHHAETARAMGFCLFGTVAIAAKRALDHHGLDRVAIVDFDVHHGNGTEAAFANDERVLMCSFFQHPLYPFSGADHQAQNMVNLPMPARSNGMAVREAVDMFWLPRLDAFKPQMVFVSAGFDAHREDDIGNLGLVEADFEWLTAQIVEVARRHAQGRIVSCLEGGYNLSALGRSVVAHLRALAGV